MPETTTGLESFFQPGVSLTNEILQVAVEHHLVDALANRAERRTKVDNVDQPGARNRPRFEEMFVPPFGKRSAYLLVDESSRTVIRGHCRGHSKPMPKCRAR